MTEKVPWTVHVELYHLAQSTELASGVPTMPAASSFGSEPPEIATVNGLSAESGEGERGRRGMGVWCKTPFAELQAGLV